MSWLARLIETVLAWFAIISLLPCCYIKSYNCVLINADSNCDILVYNNIGEFYDSIHSMPHSFSAYFLAGVWRLLRAMVPTWSTIASCAPWCCVTRSRWTKNWMRWRKLCRKVKIYYRCQGVDVTHVIKTPMLLGRKYCVFLNKCTDFHAALASTNYSRQAFIYHNI